MNNPGYKGKADKAARLNDEALSCFTHAASA